MKFESKAKKSVSLLLSFLMIISLFTALPFTAGAVNTDVNTTSETYGDFEYEILDDGTAEITDYNGSATNLEIPNALYDYTVTGIGSFAFDDCASLESVTIPDSVTSIGEWAFSECASLTNIEVNEKNTSYSSINGNLYDKDKTELIKYAIGKTDTSFTIPDSVTSISTRAFRYCASLESITIPESVTSIGRDAFDGTAWYNNQPDGLVYAGKVAYQCKGDCPATVEIKEGTVGIADYAFDGCKLTSVTIGNSVTSIGESAFENCTSLTSVTIGNGVTSIGDDAFYECISLTSVTMGNGVTSIGESAFENCKSLTNVTIPDSVTIIGSFAFERCESLKNVTIPNSVTSIGDSAFYECTSLTSVTIPYSVSSIGFGAFRDCTALTNIEVNEKNTSYSSLNGNLYNKNNTELIQYAVGKTDTSFTIPDSVTSIGGGAFEYCKSLTRVTIGNSVTSIGESAFENCTSLTSVTIPNSVTSIGDYVFCSCTSLTSITLPDSVTSIGDSAFINCTSLTSITLPDSVTSIGDGAFFDCTSLKSITIPDSVTSIGDWAFIGCTSLTSVTIPDSVTSIGDNAFYNTAWYDNQPEGLVYAGKVAYKYKGECPATLEIKDGTVGIAGSAFEYCENLTNITIPDSVTSIGEFAFYGCTSLTRVTIPNSVTEIGSDAFGYYYDENDDEYYKVENFTITGYSGTEAERYAKDNGFKFISLGEAPTTESTSTTPSESTNPTESVTSTEPYESSSSTAPSESTTVTGPSATTESTENTTATEPSATTDPTENTTATEPTEISPKPAKTTVTLKKSSATVYVKGTAQIKATVKNGKGKTTYKTSNKKVAKVNLSGKVTGVKKGTATITVTNNGVSKKFKITVKNPKLNKTKKSLKKGKSFKLSIKGKVGKAKFTSINKKVATVSKKGNIKAKKKGKATITVKTNGMKLKCKITVK